VLVWLVLIVALLLPALVAAVIAVSVHADPNATSHGPVHATADTLRRELHGRAALAAFLRRRTNAREATGLLLTIAVALLLAVGAVGFEARRTSWVVHLDRRVAEWAAAHADPSATQFLRVATDFGSTVVVVVIALLVVVLARRGDAARVALFLLLVIGGAKIIGNVLKLIVERTRPDIDQLVHAGGFSYPSGHTTAAASCFAAAALCLARGRSPRTRTALAAVAAAVVGMVAASRVLLGVHWLSDVGAGAALGGAWFALCAIAFGGRLLRFGAPVEMAARVQVLDSPGGEPGPDHDGDDSQGGAHHDVGQVVHPERHA
jgi:membrane-associated phospholipid phosphatase